MSCFEASRKHPAASQREQSVFLLYARYNFYHQHKRRSRAARNHQSLISIETHKETAMFVVKNAWKSVTRNKGRNMLIIVIVTIIAAAATIGLSIRQAAATARSSGLDNTPPSPRRSALIAANSFPNRASSPSRIPIRPMLPPNLTSTPCVPLWPTSSFRLPTIRSTRRLHPR